MLYPLLKDESVPRKCKGTIYQKILKPIILCTEMRHGVLLKKIQNTSSGDESVKIVFWCYKEEQSKKCQHQETFGSGRTLGDN